MGKKIFYLLEGWKKIDRRKPIFKPPSLLHFHLATGTTQPFRSVCRPKQVASENVMGARIGPADLNTKVAKDAKGRVVGLSSCQVVKL